MNLLQKYLSKPKVRKVLSLKPGQKGFSLIELVVVVAVLAVLSAIAIPQFSSISSKARAAAASNTLATIAKECAVKLTDPGSGTFVVPNLQGYERFTGTGATAQQKIAGFIIEGAYTAPGQTPACDNNHNIGFESTDETMYPSFFYNTDTGAKVCNASGDALLRGCNDDPGVW